jgi:hypothetical protein
MNRFFRRFGLIAAMGLIFSAPALADHGHHGGWEHHDHGHHGGWEHHDHGRHGGWGHNDHWEHRDYYRPRVVVQSYAPAYYAPPPAPVYYAPVAPAYYAPPPPPRPAYYRNSAGNVLPIVAGGVLGGLVGNELGYGSPGAVIAGSVAGSVIGNEIGR